VVPGAEPLQEGGEGGEVVTVVAVAHHHVAAACRFDSRAEGRTVAALGHGDDAGAELLGDGLRAVGAAVVGDDDLTGDAVPLDEAARLADAARQGADLVEAGHHDREFEVHERLPQLAPDATDVDIAIVHHVATPTTDGFPTAREAGPGFRRWRSSRRAAFAGS